MDIHNYFPLKHAKGKAFCNRVDERKILSNFIKMNQHVLLVSPRRYGKSSLVLYTLNEKKIIFERVDLFVAIDQRSIENLIVDGCKNLINQLFNPIEKGLQIIREYLASIKLKWIVGSDGFRIELIPDSKADPATTIMNSLKIVEAVLKRVKKPAVLFIDEFQEIGKFVGEGRGLEGAIRHVAEQTEYLTFIFSGSSRHMLVQIFDDRSRPLYNLCERINLPRISEQSYCEFLDKIALKTYGKPLPKKAYEKIFTITECHPYYMNVLCRRIWQADISNERVVKKIDTLWEDYLEQETTKIAADLNNLSPAQLKVLAAIANGTQQELTSKHNLQKLNLSSSGVIKVLNILTKKDYIESHKGIYKIIDPLIKTSLLRYYRHYFQ